MNSSSFLYSYCTISVYHTMIALCVEIFSYPSRGAKFLSVLKCRGINAEFAVWEVAGILDSSFHTAPQSHMQEHPTRKTSLLNIAVTFYILLLAIFLNNSNAKIHILDLYEKQTLTFLSDSFRVICSILWNINFLLFSYKILLYNKDLTILVFKTNRT